MNTENFKFTPPPITFSEKQKAGINETSFKNGRLQAVIDPFAGADSLPTVKLWVGRSPSSGNYLEEAFKVERPGELLVVAFSEESLRPYDKSTAYLSYSIAGGPLSTPVLIKVDFSQVT